MTGQTKAKQIRSVGFWRAVLAEYVATLIFVFLAIASGLNSPGPDATIVQIAIGSGLAIATMIQCFAHVSGAHMNPALTIALFCTRKVNILVTVFYIPAQCIGAVTGAALIYAFLPSTDSRGTLGVTSLSTGIYIWQGLFMEIIITFQMLLTFFATVDPRRSDLLGSASLAVGLAVIVGVMAGIRTTGASMNPSRSFGPAVVMNDWSDHWIYWIGPIIGAFLAAFLYEFVFEPSANIKRIRTAYIKVRKDGGHGRPVKDTEEDDMDMTDVKG